MIETHQLYESAVKAISAKQVADALNVGVNHVYKLAADPFSLDAPVRDDVLRITTLMEKLAAHPNGREALILFCVYFKDLIERLRDGDIVTPLDCAGLPERLAAISHAFGDVVGNLKPGFNANTIAKEGAELIAETERLLRCAEASDDKVTPLRPAS